ncbi:MAG: DMT family transporter [Pseudomonadota bacterium]
MDATAPRADGTLAGIGWMLLTGLMFVAVTGVVRYLGSDIPAVQAAFIRYVFGLTMIAPVLWQLAKHRPSRAALRLYGWRGLFHGFGVLLWFYAMARIPIAEVTAIGYTAPIFVAIGAAVFFGERLFARRILAIAAGLIGALVILRPGFNEISIGQLAQLGAAPLFAASFLMAKRLTEEEDPALIVGMLSVAVTLVLLPFAIWHWRPPTWEELGWLAVTAAFATAGHYTMTRAIQAAPITVTQPITFLQLVWATLLGIYAFGEPVDPWVLLGGAIIVGAATFISHREAVAARRAYTPPAPATKG